MNPLKLGAKSAEVAQLQKELNIVLGTNLVTDGDFGQKTQQAVIAFQNSIGVTPTGTADYTLSQSLHEKAKNISKTENAKQKYGIAPKNANFVVFVDAGHGGLDDKGVYQTAGKRAYHEGTNLHVGGNYFEGYENRLVAEMFCAELVKNGIQPIRTYHPYKDTLLGDRPALIQAYLRRGYCGYLHSFHSNAIDEKNTKDKLDATRGFIIYTLTGETPFGDKIAEQHWKHVEAEFSKDWQLRTEKSKDHDSDFEANFQVLRDSDTPEFGDRFGAMLEEFGFHTSKPDALFIANEKNRLRRVKCAIQTALWAKKLFGYE
jgi:peptidoglycan hydrolase-like protein with peptidoglycan-binding domain